MRRWPSDQIIWMFLHTFQWEVNDSWFPGYRWKPCLCPDCGAYIGLIFKPIDAESVAPKQLFGLILPNVISETCKYYIIFLWFGMGFVGVLFLLKSWMSMRALVGSRVLLMSLFVYDFVFPNMSNWFRLFIRIVGIKYVIRLPTW